MKPETYPDGHSATQNSSYIKGLPGQVRQTAPGKVEIAKYWIINWALSPLVVGNKKGFWSFRFY